MYRKTIRLTALALLATWGLALGGCAEESPTDGAGSDADKAAEDAGDAMDKAGDAMDNADDGMDGG